MERMDEKLQPIIAENKILKTKLENVDKELKSLKRAKKQNNLIVFGIKEDEKSNLVVLQKVKKVFKTDLSMNIEDLDVNNIYRIVKAENYSKEVQRRKTLQPQLIEERKKGNIAYLKFDEIIIKGKSNTNNEKRVRKTTTSPENNN
ncbi:unnamed protein product [Leptidea sinapis]|uniref:Endonuclease-reverse transcriptase n=1 Tax=Leptidea sinapis TaxID=189913 RepID=A0A5E4QGE3_9NEOP|nr:unnamed protein product [Leptidea sinapis]